MSSQNWDSTSSDDCLSAPQCGLIMPISAIDGCTEQHWAEVRQILTEAIESAGFDASLVCDADDVGVIQKRIIQNLYHNPVIVCDVSAKNPNVMFELGMRLAFDKPTIIVKDDETCCAFDTSPIEHLEYPRDLRFAKIVDFKQSLAQKVSATYEEGRQNPTYTTFLKNFGSFAVVSLEMKEVSKEDYIIEEIQELRRVLARIEAGQRQTAHARETTPVRFQRDKRAVREAVAEVVKEMQEEGDLSLPDMEDELIRRVYRRLHHGLLTRRSGELNEMIEEALYS